MVEEKLNPVEIIPEQSEKPLEEDLSWEDKGEKIGDEIKVEKETDTGTFKIAPIIIRVKISYCCVFLCIV